MTDQMDNTCEDYYINMERDMFAPNVAGVKASNVNPENINEHTEKSIIMLHALVRIIMHLTIHQ